MDSSSSALRQSAVSFGATLSVSLRYLLYLPTGYDPESPARWPLMLFLHGAGERGDDLERVASHGPCRIVRDGVDFPFILVSPQCPEGATWNPETLLALLDDLERRHRVDPTRIYLTGLSMGGFGSWALALRDPARFAAVAPICGGVSFMDIANAFGSRAGAAASLPVWTFHGEADTVVPVEETVRAVEELRRRGNADVRLTLYPGVGHESWSRAYGSPELFDWFLSHCRPERK